MIVFLACLLVGFQAPSEIEGDVWQEINQLEGVIQKTVNAVQTHGMVLPSDPVRGYYFQGQGIIFFVPIRYRTREVRTVDLEFPNSSSMMKSKDRRQRGEISWNQQVRDWKNQVKKREAIKDAAFSEVLQALSHGLPDLVARLPHLADEESLILVVEEREPAWVFGSFGPSTQFKRKITTLKIEGHHLAALRQNSQTTQTLGPYVSRKTQERPVNLGSQSKSWNGTPEGTLK